MNDKTKLALRISNIGVRYPGISMPWMPRLTPKITAVNVPRGNYPAVGEAAYPFDKEDQECWS